MKEIVIDDFVEILGELRDSLVIVEGKRDESALRRLGIENIIALNGKPLNLVVESISESDVKEVTIMTDFDKTGKMLHAKLKKLLQNYKIKTNARLRKKFKEFGKNRIEDFNKIDTSLIRCVLMKDKIYSKRGDYYGKVSSYFNKIHNKSSHKSKWYCGKT